MIALALLLSLAGDVHWQHTLVRHESYDEFQYGSGIRCEIIADGGPLRLWPRGLTYRPKGAEEELEKRVTTAYPPEGWPEGWARYETLPLLALGSFNELAVSWNANVPADDAIAVEISVARKKDSNWSPWLFVGEWGTGDWSPPGVKPFERVTQFDGGKIDVDYFVSDQEWDMARYRITASSKGKLAPLDVRRVVLCASKRLDGPAAASAPVSADAKHRIAVPFRSQKSEKPELSGRICSPTSVSMVMAFRGVDVPTAQAAERMFDAAHDIYGNWTRAVQGAYSFGVPGYVARFASWGEVEKLVAKDQPLVISIAANEGELDGAPYTKTDGHLLVLCGFDDKGDVLVNDPAAADAAKGQATYKRDQLSKVWLARGGTAYVLLPKEK